MEFKGTKGKWTIEESIDEKRDQPVLDINSSDCAQKSIITVWSGLDINDNIDEETRANAQLASKAPELLEMVKDMLDAIITGREVVIEDVKKLIEDATVI